MAHSSQARLKALHHAAHVKAVIQAVEVPRRLDRGIDGADGRSRALRRRLAQLGVGELSLAAGFVDWGLVF